MADTQIDELRLDITVEDKTSGESSDKKVKNLATAISRLNKNLQAFDNAKFTKVFDNMSKGLDPFVKKIEKVSNALASLATIVSKGGLDKAVKEVTGKVPELKTETISDSGRKSEPMQAVQGQAEELGNISEQTKKLAEVSNDWAGKLDIAKRQLELIEEKLASGKLKESQIVAYQSKRISLLDKIDKINQQITKEKEKQEKTDEDGGKKEEKKATSLSKLLKSFGRIAIYRAVRRTIQEITQAFMESIDGIAKYNSEFRNTMGSLQSSMAKAKASMGVAFYQVLILLEPLITRIANGIANLANSLAKVAANMRGVANYTKINTEYMKDYQSATQGALLAFDTFTTLSGSQGADYSKLLYKGDDADKLTEDEERLKNILSAISDIGKSIKEIWGNIKPSLEPILDLIVDIFNGISKGIKWLKDNDALTPILEGVLALFLAIKAPIAAIIFGVALLIENFSKLSDGCKAAALIAGALVATLAAAFTPGGVIAKTVAAAATFAMVSGLVSKAIASSQTKAFANGGMFEGAGTMYALAGESGAEVVAAGSAGTGVLNVDQFADAMVSALVRYGAARDTSNGTTIVLDGNKVGQLVASNVGFRNEANRRNAGLNWK